MKIGFLFPGQGTQTVGMGEDLYKEYQTVRDIYNKIKQLTGVDISEITFKGTQENLNETDNTQICILAMSLAVLELLKESGIEAEISSGLSLGEYTALIYSGALSFEDGIQLVKKRGEYMKNLVPQGEWLMAAVLGMEDTQVEDICRNVQSGFVVPVNYNCKSQIVISGEKQAVEEAEIKLKEAGAKKVRVLKTSGPFHTEKLNKASEVLKQDLNNIEFKQFNTPVIKNIDGSVYTSEDNIKEVLEKHIVSPVHFSKGLQTMLDMGIDTFIEIGPGKTLSGFVKRMDTDKEIHIYNINSVDTLNSTIKTIKEDL